MEKTPASYIVTRKTQKARKLNKNMLLEQED
jgi:hypothetical protein